MDAVYLTRDGHDRLSKELEVLKTQKRRKLSREVESARLHGDISENAEYDAAKEALAMNEKRIAELEDSLARTRIIEDENIPADRVFIGARVKLQQLDTGEETEYLLVSELEADSSEGKISITSPIGKGLLGKREGETAEIRVPAGVIKYKVLKITRG